MAEDTPRLMTLNVAAARYSISRKTIERHIRQGLIARVKIGGATRLRIADADEYFTAAARAKSGLQVGPANAG